MPNLKSLFKLEPSVGIVGMFTDRNRRGNLHRGRGLGADEASGGLRPVKWSK